ncbi:MAG: GntR family transcriptional regulator [Armatimonadota bacterium]|nr:GntR family transcriptional regulator [Armatimonadota bacterium]MDR5676997.1 GntR family transcriptional regulator [Armatimonadota bacterium]MDR5689698.1 GntR family transcriptional regulator [Armatimonadota bacterium]MDR7389085.1 GntR family transcriptional regulator [Armatimonadota bacterium]MDR7392041.1 GntR family transcriptional regulator [Armatimonadota bacterium]
MRAVRPKRGEGEAYCYQQLRRAVLEGRLVPGQRLVETELARMLGVGRAAVRTALARLEQEGVVERSPNRGARVRLLTEEEAVEILEARAALECLAARHAALRARPQDVRELRAILREMAACARRGDSLGYSECNGRFHHVLVRASGHATAQRLLDSLWAQMVRYQYRTVLAPGRLPRSLEEHRAIVDAVAAKDPDAAEARMRAHLQAVLTSLREVARRTWPAAAP